MNPKPQCILFITSTYLGDAIISTTAFEWLRSQYPDAKITIACGHIAAPIFEAVPNLEQLYVIRKQKYGLHTLKLWWALCRKHWDYILDIRGTGIGYLMCSKHHKVWKSTQNITQSRVQQIATLLGLETPTPCKIYLAEKHRAEAKNLLPQNRPILLLSPMASWDKKCWPAQSFLELAKALTAENGPLPNAAIGFLGDPKQRPALLELLQALPENQRIDISGNINLLTLAACMEQADLFVGNDSGLMHLAAAVGTSTLGIFGPSRPEVYAPFGSKADYIRVPMPYEQMMSSAQAGENHMDLLKTEDVLKSCLALIKTNSLDKK